MHIDFSNKDKINNINVHDSIFKGFIYDYDNRRIILECKYIDLNKAYSIKFSFNNVIMFFTQSCSFWHGGNNIMDFYLKDNSIQMNELIKRQKENSELYKCSYLDMGIDYLQIGILINSGDELLIAAESIDYEKVDILD